MLGYKGFDKDMKCKDFQYEQGKEYKTELAKLCNEGFHFCEYPLDVFAYYPPVGNTSSSVMKGFTFVNTRLMCLLIILQWETHQAL